MRTFRAAVLGSPIAHSLSPLIHQVAYQSLEISASYQAIEVASGGLSEFLGSIPVELNSFSLTMPLKEELVNMGFRNSELANRIRSANTLFNVDGEWRVESTDVIGFQQAIAIRSQAMFREILIIGAGATARAAAAALDNLGAKIDVLSRSSYREAAMSECALFAQINFIDFEVKVDWSKYDLVINTTPAGAADNLVPQVTSTGAMYFESLYNPWPTAMSQHWRSAELEVIDGLDLLVHQAISQIALFTQHPVNRAQLAPIMRTAALQRL